MLLDTKNKILKSFHPKLEYLNNKFIPIFLIFNMVSKINHLNFQIFDEIDMTVQIYIILEVFIETVNYYMIYVYLLKCLFC